MSASGYRAGVGLFIGVAAALAGTSLFFPVTRWDTPTYLYIGRLLLSGGLPYRDFIDTKNPAIFFVFAFQQWLWDNEMLGFRIFEVCWQIGTAIILGHLALRITSRKWSAVHAGAAYLVIYYTQGYWNWAQPDGMLSLPLAGCIWFLFLAIRTNTRLPWLLAGLCLAIAVLFKITIVVAGIVIMFAAARCNPRLPKAFLVRLLLVTAGAAIPLAACALFFWKSNGLSEFLHAQFQLGPAYSQLMRSQFQWTCAAQIFTWPLSTPLYLAVIVGACGWLWTLHERASLPFEWQLVALWLLASAASVILQARFLNPHLMVLIAPAAMVAVCSLAVYFDSPAPARFKKVLAALWIAMALIPVAKLGQHLVVAFDNQRAQRFDYSWAQLGARLQNMTAPDDAIAVWGNVPAVYIYSHRKSATRFLATFFVEAGLPGLDYHQAYLADFNRSQPAYVVVAKETWRNDCGGPAIDFPSTFHKFQGLQNIIAAEYQAVENTPQYVLYRRTTGQRHANTSPLVGTLNAAGGCSITRSCREESRLW